MHKLWCKYTYSKSHLLFVISYRAEHFSIKYMMSFGDIISIQHIFLNLIKENHIFDSISIAFEASKLTPDKVYSTLSFLTLFKQL